MKSFCAKIAVVSLLFLGAFNALGALNAESLIFSIPDDEDVMKQVGTYSQEKLDPQNIKILVWNVYKGKESGWGLDYTRMSQGKDLILLQEMYLDRGMGLIFRSNPSFAYETATSFIYNSDDVRTGVATASRVKPTRLIWRRSPGREPVIGTPKMGLITIYPMSGTDQKLMVANIHAINFVGKGELKDQLKDMAKQMKDFNGPLIFGGDFNTWTPGKVAIMYKTTKKLGLQEVDFPNDERKEVFGHYIDYIFTRDLGVDYSETHGHLESSDHVAMSADLYVEEKQPEEKTPKVALGQSL